MSNDEKWESESLEWIHRIRREMAERGENGPMPIEKQKALAARYGLKLVRLRQRTDVSYGGGCIRFGLRPAWQDA